MPQAIGRNLSQKVLDDGRDAEELDSQGRQILDDDDLDEVCGLCGETLGKKGEYGVRVFQDALEGRKQGRRDGRLSTASCPDKKSELEG